jgi:hypothetical protein
MKTFLIGAAAVLALTGAAAAQSSTVTGAAGGAATGAIVGGPVGAAVGGVAGAILGTAVDPPPARVREYVVAQRAPSVVVAEPVVVGSPLPGEVAVYPVPEEPGYSYAIVNEQRVIVDTRDGRVVQIID